MSKNPMHSCIKMSFKTYLKYSNYCVIKKRKILSSLVRHLTYLIRYLMSASVKETVNFISLNIYVVTIRNSSKEKKICSIKSISIFFKYISNLLF